MSTANFKSMDNFPLIVADNPMGKQCPDCGLFNGGDIDKCDECGCDLSTVEAVYDDCEADYIRDEMESVAERLNAEQSFYKVSVESGYYAGIQFYVDSPYCLDELTNEDAQYHFGLCRSKALRKARAAANMITRKLRRAKSELGLMELACIGRFSNGEAVYRKVA